MLGIDEGADAAALLGLGNGLQRQRGLAGGLRPVDLDDPALGQPANAKRDIKAKRSRWDRFKKQAFSCKVVSRGTATFFVSASGRSRQLCDGLL